MSKVVKLVSVPSFFIKVLSDNDKVYGLNYS